MNPGSPEYKAATAKLLTASSFAAAIGLNPYCSRQQLWRLKTNREVFDGNHRTRYGQDNEHRAISAYEVATGALVAPGRFIVNPEYPTLGATPDGFVGACGLLETKCPESVYKEVPIYYLPQMIGQMAIAKKETCDFVAWTPAEMRIWHVMYSAEAWEWMLSRLFEMWTFINEDVEPPRFSKSNPKPDAAMFRSLVGVHTHD